MKKTFYSVTYSTWGKDRPTEKWFDNLEEAKKFAARDYCDNPIAHTFRNAEKIAEIEEIIAMQNCEL